VTDDNFHDNDMPENGSGVGGAIHMDVASQPTFARIAFANNYINAVWVDPGTFPAGISNWDDPDVVYFVPRTVDVPHGATLKIAAGQVIKLIRSITVEGSLQALGTAAHPVIFTSTNDDSAGGQTTTLYGTPGQPHRGDWTRSSSTTRARATCSTTSSSGTAAAAWTRRSRPTAPRRSSPTASSATPWASACG
jgi:hypothetical protein